MAAKDVPMLILRGEGEMVREWTLDRAVTTLGRDETNDICLPDRLVSRHHARIYRRGGQCVLEDCKSKNGTFVNGRPVRGMHRLQDGDEIQIAMRFRLFFVDAEATAPLFFPGRAHKGVEIDPGSRRVWVDGHELSPPLSAAQFVLLELLHTHANNVVSRDEIARTVWPDAAGAVSEQAIDALIRRLRDRLAEGNPHHQYIVTLRGHGFMLNNPV